MKKAALICFAAFSTVLALGLVACGDDEEGGPTGPGSIGDSNEGTAEGLAYGIVLPLIRDFFVETYIDQIPTGAPLPSVTACEPLTFCTSGSGEICIDGVNVDINFTDCAAFGTVVDGAINLVLGDGEGNGTFSMTWGDDISLSGSVGYSSNPECFGQTFSNVTVIVGELSILMSGFISWCEPRNMIGEVVVPSSATFEFIIPSLNQLVDVAIFSDPVGDMEVVILDINRTEIQYVCHGGLLENDLSCGS